ncbi:unnamed protein product [Microthlaspi erraticum]|uniref:Uncharacterized protein n=1 Tax=Microthlaspi erraticum TaxID=1685480 RepID=A0A6D2KIN7_9BRAS|nr:unnamed protein product [Microthlaspi erraticum]CAA7040763.1 unnamed protein product [Microthlaspi erraticum]CAA7049114.1 unnamed protein product [Microthlaspi erraticum]CAA7052865.1 unnamed protein product [Microthlaspi erraticum]
MPKAISNDEIPAIFYPVQTLRISSNIPRIEEFEFSPAKPVRAHYLDPRLKSRPTQAQQEDLEPTKRLPRKPVNCHPSYSGRRKDELQLDQGPGRHCEERRSQRRSPSNPVWSEITGIVSCTWRDTRRWIVADSGAIKGA